jgi:hypothetical protein
MIAAETMGSCSERDMPAKVEHWANHREPAASGQGRERHRGPSDRRIGPHAISLLSWPTTHWAQAKGKGADVTSCETG